MASNSLWTEVEDNILKTYYPKEHGEVCKRLPGRTKNACQTRASFLGIAKKQENKPEYWSDEELAILAKYYPSEGACGTSARLPGRSIAACRIQASTMGIRYGENWTEKELEILRKYYPLEGTKCEKRIPGRTKTACKAQARVQGLKKSLTAPKRDKCVHSNSQTPEQEKNSAL